MLRLLHEQEPIEQLDRVVLAEEAVIGGGSSDAARAAPPASWEEAYAHAR
jgi:hypothetical protein